MRWSSAKQTAGDSLERQTNKINEYVAKHRLVLANVSYKDVGISASKGKNAKDGALGAFITACEKGVVQSGSYLLVEAFDRLSRAKPMEAFRLFQDIVGFGITIVTLDDGHHYDDANIDANWTMLIMALAKMVGAYEENEKRAGRVRVAWTGNRDDGGMITSVGPAWLKLVGPKPGRDDKGKRERDRRQWVKIPEKVAIVQRVFELATKEYGAPAIAKMLNDSNVPTMTDKGKLGKWTQGVVMAMLKNEAVIGNYQRRDGTDRREGYYGEPIIGVEDYWTVQRLISARHHAGKLPEAEDEIRNLFSARLYCECGAKLRAVNGNKYRYIQCIKAYEHAGCDAIPHPYNAFEANILDKLLWIFQEPLVQRTQIAPDPLATMRAELESKQKALLKLLETLHGGNAVAAEGMTKTFIDKKQAEIDELQLRIQSTVPAMPLDGVTEKAVELLFRHQELQEAGDSDALREVRREMKGSMKLLLSKISFAKTHRTEIPHARVQREFGIDKIVFGRYLMEGPFVERLQAEIADGGGITRGAGDSVITWTEKDMGVPKKKMWASNTPLDWQITKDGVWVDFELLNWAGREAITRKRRAKPKS